MKRTLFQFSFTTNRQCDNENEDNVNGDSESESDSNQTDGPSRSKKTKVKKTFQTSWLAKWPWLRKDEKGMKCKVCLDHKKANTFTGSSGCDNYRSLNILMTIKIEGGKVEDYDFTSAIRIWKGKKQRRLCSK